MGSNGRRTPAGARASTVVVTHPDAGHRVLFPGEREVASGAVVTRGGTTEADSDLGTAAWPQVLRVLGLSDT
jgi:hypothetical protein